MPSRASRRDDDAGIAGVFHARIRRLSGVERLPGYFCPTPDNAKCAADMSGQTHRTAPRPVRKPCDRPSIDRFSALTLTPSMGIPHPDMSSRRVRGLPVREATASHLILHFRGLGNNSQVPSRAVRSCPAPGPLPLAGHPSVASQIQRHSTPLAVLGQKLRILTHVFNPEKTTGCMRHKSTSE